MSDLLEVTGIDGPYVHVICTDSTHPTKPVSIAIVTPNDAGEWSVFLKRYRIDREQRGPLGRWQLKCMLCPRHVVARPEHASAVFRTLAAKGVTEVSLAGLQAVL